MKKFKTGDRIIIVVKDCDDVGASCIGRDMTGVIVDDRIESNSDWYDVEIDGSPFTWALQDHHMDFLCQKSLISEQDLMEVLL